MITKIGVISGKILELLEDGNGMLVCGEIESRLNETHDLVFMSLGWLLKKGYVQIWEKTPSGTFMHDWVVRKSSVDLSSMKIKETASLIDSSVSKVNILLEGFGNLLTMENIERNVKAERDVVLMALGWLIREGHARGISHPRDIFISRLTNEMAELNAGSLNPV